MALASRHLLHTSRTYKQEHTTYVCRVEGTDLLRPFKALPPSCISCSYVRITNVPLLYERAGVEHIRAQIVRTCTPPQITTIQLSTESRRLSLLSLFNGGTKGRLEGVGWVHPYTNGSSGDDQAYGKNWVNEVGNR